MIEEIDIDFIEIPAGRRPVDEVSVDTLATSIAQIGLRTPITLLDLRDGTNLKLVAGHHRLRAAQKLGWDKIPSFLIENDTIDAELWEISENLHRAELTVLERDQQVARWIELQEVSAQSAPKPQGGRPEGGINAASKQLGIDRSDAQRAVKVASISEQAKEAAKVAGLDNNRSALLEASKAPAGEQAAVIHSISERKKSGVDSDVKRRAAQECAEIISENVPHETWDILKANLYAAGARNVADALTNLVSRAS